MLGKLKEKLELKCNSIIKAGSTWAYKKEKKLKERKGGDSVPYNFLFSSKSKFYLHIKGK